MKNNIIKYKESFFMKIKKLFSKLFKNKTETLDFNENKLISEKKEYNFFDELKVETNNTDKIIDKKSFLKYIDGNVEALNSLSVDRLKKLTEYYDEIIKENDKIIEKLKADD